jgi:hypothetical protein
MVCAPNCSVACLRAFGRRRPLEIFAQTALYLAGKNPAKATQIHAFAEKAVTASRAISHEFRDGIDGYFFDGDAGLAKRDQTLRFFLMRLVGFSVSRSEPVGQASQRDASTKPFTQRSRERELNERSIDLCRRLENVGIARKEALDLQTEPKVSDRGGARELHRF